MEGLLIIVGLVVLAIPVAVLYLLVSHSGLKAQVAELRREVTVMRRAAEAVASARLSSEPSTQDVPAPLDNVADVVEEPAPEGPDTPVEPVAADVPDTPIEDLPPAARVLAARNAAHNTGRAAAGDPQSTSTPPRASVRAEPTEPLVFDRFLGWIAENWFYAVSALSLALRVCF